MNEQVVIVNTGEVTRSATDLMIQGRGIDFDLTRYYSSAITHVGPLGRNFDSPLFARVQTLPSGDLVYYDGTGRRDVFVGGTTPPDGVFLNVRRAVDGKVVVAYPGNTSLYFDSVGRLAKITDRNTTKTDGSDGNAMHFQYGANGELATVIDPTGRTINFQYYKSTGSGAFDGCISKVKDFDDRTVEYTYDDSARLTKVVGPNPESANSATPSTAYEWGSAATVGAKQPLYTSGQIRAERDGLSRTIWTAGYNGSYAWSGQTLTSGGGTWTFALNTDNTSVLDPNGHTREYMRNADGRIASLREPGGATRKYTFDAGRLASVIRPLGDKTTYGYGIASPSGDRRPMSNIETITEHPRAGSEEAALGVTRQMTIGYGPANLPVVITAPDGATTSIVRDARGNRQTVTDASGLTATYSFNARGLLNTMSDPRSGVSTYTYVPGGTREGYLASITNSDGVTMVATDDRGNVTKVVRPGNNVWTFDINKLDQVEKQIIGTAVTRTRFDAARNATTEEALASSDPSTGPIFTVTNMAIDEVGRLTARTENGVPTTYGYDPAWNLKTITHPGLPSITYSYNDLNYIESIVEGARTTAFTHDADGVQTSAKNARGKISTFTINGFGEQIGSRVRREMALSIAYSSLFRTN